MHSTHVYMDVSTVYRYTQVLPQLPTLTFYYLNEPHKSQHHIIFKYTYDVAVQLHYHGAAREALA